jgi:hypothetical protein
MRKNNLKEDFPKLLEEVNRLSKEMESAKTNLKRQYFSKKLEKIKQKVTRYLITESLRNPSLMKKNEEPVEKAEENDNTTPTE